MVDRVARSVRASAQTTAVSAECDIPRTFANLLDSAVARIGLGQPLGDPARDQFPEGQVVRKWPRTKLRRRKMTAIGHVTRNANGGFKGEVRTLTVRADIDIVPNETKSGESQPDYRVLSDGVEVGAAWNRRSETSGRDYVSVSLAAPEFGPRRLYANLGRASGSDENSFALIWNPAD